MKKFLIGGGDFTVTAAINEYIVGKLTAVRESGRKPFALFIPTASFESKPAVNSFYREYGSRLKCKATCAIWAKGEMDREHIAEKFRKADLIYIGGGRYDILRAEWDKMGIWELLREASERAILAGNSAGGLALTEQGISDYRIARGVSDAYALVNGLGLIKGVFCPHAEEEERRKAAEMYSDVIFVNSAEYKEFD